MHVKNSLRRERKRPPNGGMTTSMQGSVELQAAMVGLVNEPVKGLKKEELAQSSCDKTKLMIMAGAGSD